MRVHAVILGLLASVACGLDIRVANGCSEAAELRVGEDQGTVVSSTGPRAAGSYNPIAASGNATTGPLLQLFVGKTRVELPAWEDFAACNSSKVTVVAVELAASVYGANAHCDLAEQWVTDGIDRARVRWVSAMPRAVQVRATTSVCYKCRKPVQTPLLLPGAVSVAWPVRPGSELPGRPEPSSPGYAVFRTSFDLEFDITDEPSGSVPLPGSAGPPPSSPRCADVLTVSEHEVMTVFVFPTSTGGNGCSLVSVSDVSGDSTVLPLLVGVLCTIGAGIAIKFALIGYDSCTKRGDAADDDMSGGGSYVTPAGRDLRAKAASSKASTRVEAIDIWRGMCLFVMVFVNYGGAGYWWLDHSAWNGLTVADVVFACFVFTMGASMALSLRSQRRRGATSCQMTQRMAWRALKLLLVGLFLNNGLVLEQWRFLGVLQYFAVAALCVALIDIWVPKLALASPSSPPSRSGGSTYARAGAAMSGSALRERSVNSGAGGLGGSGDIFEEAAVAYQDSSSEATTPLRAGLGGSEYAMLDADTAAARAFHHEHASDGRSTWCSGLCVAVWGDVTPYLMEWLVIAGLEAVYLCVQFFLPVPGCPTGYLGPGGLADDAKHFNCPGGAHGYIDRLVWGDSHMYHNQDANGAIVSAATCADSFRCPVYDPEGTLGAINAVVIAFLGLQAGRIMLAHKTPKRATGADGGEEEEDEKESQNPCSSGLTGVALRWLVWGVACGLIAGALCGFSQNEGVIPVTKNLWSPSYILGMAGASFFMLAVLLVVVDQARLWDGTPFTFIGKNSIAVYCLSEIFQMFAPFTIVVNAAPAFAIDQEFRSHTEASVANFIGVSCIALVALWLARNKIFIKL